MRRSRKRSILFVGSRWADAFSALGVYVSPPPGQGAPRAAPRNGCFWADVRGTNWSTNQQTGRFIRGRQTNGLPSALTPQAYPDFLVGAFRPGWRIFDYTSQLLTGTSRATGWTARRLFWAGPASPGVPFLSRRIHMRGIGYDGGGRDSVGLIPGPARSGHGQPKLVGHRQNHCPGFESRTRRRVYWLWEHETAYTDQPGAQQCRTPATFFPPAAPVPAPAPRLPYPGCGHRPTTVAPYLGPRLRLLLNFNRDDATFLPVHSRLLLPTDSHSRLGRGLRCETSARLSVKSGAGAQFLRSAG